MRSAVSAVARAETRAAGIRASAESLALFQPARCALGDFRDRAPALHFARAYAGARSRAVLLRFARAAAIPARAAGLARRVSGEVAGAGAGEAVMKQDLLIEIGTEELPPKALLQLSEAFHAAFADL